MNPVPGRWQVGDWNPGLKSPRVCFRLFYSRNHSPQSPLSAYSGRDCSSLQAKCHLRDAYISLYPGV